MPRASDTRERNCIPAADITPNKAWQSRVRGLWRRFVLQKSPLSRDGDWSAYYDAAEADAAWQWPIIESYLKESPKPDLSIVLDFACGRGRIAERFADISGKLICTDMSVDAIEACRRRFGGNPNVECLVNRKRIHSRSLRIGDVSL